MGKLSNKWYLFWFNLFTVKNNPEYEQMFLLGPLYIYITVQCWMGMYPEPEYNTLLFLTSTVTVAHAE